MFPHPVLFKGHLKNSAAESHDSLTQKENPQTVMLTRRKCASTPRREALADVDGDPVVTAAL